MTPCPFCGDDAPFLHERIIHHNTKRYKDYYYFCGNCQSEGPCADSKDEAERLWNDRCIHPAEK